MLAVRFFLWSTVAVYAGVGLAALIAPERLLAGAGVILAPGSAVADVRATYGGAILGTAVFLIWCVRRMHLRAGLLAVACIMGGALGGRLLGWLLAPAQIEAVWVGVAEAAWAAAAVGLWRYLTVSE